MTRFSLIVSLVFTTLALPACESVNSNFSKDEPQIVAAPDKVSVMLADAADRASNALETLAAIEHARAPATQIGPIGNAPIELRRAVTVNWIGPVAPISKSLAHRAGYEFRTIGAIPPIPVIVSVNVENQSVIDVLRDIGLQLGVRGDLKIDSRRRIVEIHYPPNTGSGG